MTSDKGWATCPRCGKERQVDAILLPIADSCICLACSAEMDKERTACPETVTIPGGASACTLGWKHRGRCEPYPPLTKEEVQAARAAGPTHGCDCCQNGEPCNCPCDECEDYQGGRKGIQEKGTE